MEGDIRKAIQRALKELGVSDSSFALERPADMAHGDWSTSVALAYAKQLGKNPRALAEEILAILSKNRIAGVEKIEIAGPGFINFTVGKDYFFETLKKCLANNSKWGSGTFYEGKEILFEYTSPNLFKQLHIGNLVGNVVGESVSRLMEFSGGQVRRINYPSDIGLTVAMGVWGLQKNNSNPEDILALSEAYRTGRTAYENDPTAKAEIDAINKKLYEGSDPELNRLREIGKKTSKKHLDDICRRLGTAFDTEIFESEVGDVGKSLVEANIGRVFEKSEGALVYNGEKRGLHTRVFLNSMGLPTYEAKDLGNFDRKRGKYPDFDSSYVVTGGEQQEYFKVVIAAIKEVFPEVASKELGHIATGMLSLTTGKMSSRKGNVLTGEDLLAELNTEAKERILTSDRYTDNVDALADDIAVAALKFQILKGGAGKNIIFDKEKSLSFEGDSGPYIQYTTVRARSLVAKAGEAGIVPSTDTRPDTVGIVEKLLERFPETCERAAREREPHHVATYAIELASAFNSWYAQEKIIDTSDALSPYRVAVTAAVQTVLTRALWLLGIRVPEGM